MAAENEEFLIEKILDRRGASKASYQYHIKWDGYDSDENTWETRADLVKDGFAEQLDEYDANIKNAKSKKSSSSRARSKTPQPSKRTTTRSRTPAKSAKKSTKKADKSKAPPEPASEDDSSDESSQSEKDSTESSSASETEQVENEAVTNTQPLTKSQVPSNLAAMLILSFIFMASVFGSVVANSLVASGLVQEFAEQLNTMVLLNEPIPTMVCIYAMFKFGSHTDYTNRAIATLSWVTMTKFCLATLAFHTENPSNTNVLFTMAMWQFMMLLALYADSWNTLPSGSWAASWLCYVAVVGAAAYHYHFFESHRLSLYEYGLGCLAMFAFCRSFILVVFSMAKQMSTVLEFYATCVGSLYVFLYLIDQRGRVVDQYSNRIESMKVIGFPDATFSLDLFQVTLNLLLWTCALALMTSSILYHD